MNLFSNKIGSAIGVASKGAPNGRLEKYWDSGGQSDSKSESGW